MSGKYEKYVDESWKETAAKEKERLDQANPAASKPKPEPEVKQESAQAHGHSHDHSHDHGHSHESEEELAGLQVNFLNYISSLGYQAMIFLGQIPHPATNQIEQNLEQAKFIIDTLIVLRAKTKGNLTKQEEDMLNTSVYELQMRYVELTQTELNRES